MLKKDSSTDGQCNSRRFNTEDSPNFFSAYRNSRNQYDHAEHKLDDELKMSAQYLPRTCCSTNTKDHFQDLNEKFQELESKMFEVEKCFKDANKREIDEVRRLMDKNEMKSPSESMQNMQKSRLYEISECMKEMSPCPSNGMQEWFGDQNHSTVTEKKKIQNRIVRNGSGDALQLQGEELSEDSCKTLIRSNEKLPFRHGVKGIFTLKHFDDGYQSPKNHIPENNDNSPDVDFLEKSKKLILTLIDKELKKIESKPKHFVQTNDKTTLNADNSPDALRTLKVECIKNIERELMTLKKLEALEPYKN